MLSETVHYHLFSSKCLHSLLCEYIMSRRKGTQEKSTAQHLVGFVPGKILNSLSRWQHRVIFARSENIQDLCECTHRGPQVSVGSPPMPLKHLSTQQDLSDDRRSRRVKRGIEREVSAGGGGVVRTQGILGGGWYMQGGQNQWVPV